jgi:macrolide transport system ATP-binding/permease protein
MKLDFLLPWRRARRDEELEEEVRSHLLMAESDRIALGQAPSAAAAGARREFGNVALVQEITREMWGGAWLERLGQDLKFGFRILRRSPGFSLLAILCLTLGIGANAAVYGWIEGILLRPYPGVAHQERLLVLAGTERGSAGFTGVSWPDFDDLRRSCRSFDAFIAEKITGTTLSIGDRAERLPGSMVSANYFEALGVPLLLGRGFEPDEETGHNAHPVTVISHQLWKRRFNGDPAVIGKTQIFNGVPHTIVGVAPEGFYGTFVGYAFQFWVPTSMQDTFDSTGYTLQNRGERWIEGFVRIKPGVTRQQAQDEISSVARRLESDFPATNRGYGIELIPISRSPFNITASLLPTFRIALGVVAFVLLIACANVGNLLLVKSFARRREMTIRLAVGAGRGRLLAQLLTEGLILSSFAAVAGLVVAYWLRNALVLLIPPLGVPVQLAGHVDWRVLVASAAVCVVSTVLVGLVPAVQAGKIDLAGALKCESGGVVGGSGKLRLRTRLVLLQVSLSFLLLVGAGLLIQSMKRIRTASPGFSTRGVLATGVDLKSAGYDAARARVFQDELIERVRAIPGVQSAAYSRIRPFSYRTYTSAPILVDGYQPGPDERPAADFNEVGPGFFATLGIPLVSGREFTQADDESGDPVAIVNQAMAAQYWRGGDPVGRRVQVKGRWLRVVGVARMAKYRNLLEPPKPFLYVPLRQNPAITVNLAIRTPLASGTLSTALAREIHALDRNLAPLEVITMREQVDRMTSSQRVAVTLLGAFGGLALLLAAIGLYGVMSHAVSQSTRELGLRMALGAKASDLLRLVMTHGFALTAAGVGLGAVAALLLTRLLGYLLYEVSPRDPVAFGSAFVVLAIATLLACIFPAWRATRTDPVRALRD